MQHEPIRIRLVPKRPGGDAQNPRDAFWRVVRGGNETIPDVAASEAQLCREFGQSLRRLLLKHLSEPLRSVDSTLFRSEFRDLEHLWFRYFDRPRPEKAWDDGRAFDAFARLIEQRQQFLRESPGLSKVQEKVAAASTILFSVQIAGYSSLNLDLSVGSLKSVVEVFDKDFESFRIFLEAFIPQAFADVFDSETADRVDFTVRVPDLYAQSFNSPSPQSIAAQVPPIPPAPTGVQPSAAGRERAEWLWRLANGSLLVPLLLSLLVVWQGVAMLKDIRASQFDILKPILEHQLKLLEEDRRRLLV